MLERRYARPPEQVMRLARMGRSYPHKLSFSRQLIRALIAERAEVRKTVWDLDDEGYGQAVYSLDLGGHTYSLVAISSPLEDDQRSDRVIAEAWDACFTLFDGIPTAEDLERLAANQPLQEGGRYSVKELTLSRANKSVRLFNAVRDALARGEQPDPAQINATGYLMRTTAVYGNGKFGIADRADFAHRRHMGGPFQAEMLTVWLIRAFTHDLVEHCAKALNPQAADLDPKVRRHLGVGNSTGLGMAPFLVHHPELLSKWVEAREAALMRALAENRALDPSLLTRAQSHLAQWSVADEEAETDIRQTEAEMKHCPATTAQTLDDWAQAQSLGTQELCAALILENSDIEINDLGGAMAWGGQSTADFTLPVAELVRTLETNLAWALDDQSPEHWFWYVSENKLEPRVGQRMQDEGAEQERPLTIARDMRALYQAAQGHAGKTCADLLRSHPHLLTTLHRALVAMTHPFSEIQESLLSPSMRPIDMLRFKLSFFGAAKFDPKSSLWTRITLFQGAPMPSDVAAGGSDDWWLAAL